jgi:hypothetical protein
MTEDRIAALLTRLCESVDGMRKDIGELKTDLAVNVRAGQDLERRITQVEGDVRWAFRGALGGILAPVLAVIFYLFRGQ